MDLCIYGLGYIGLPTAVVCAEAGLHVHGVEISETKRACLAEGSSPIEEPGLQEALTACLQTGRLKVSAQPTQAAVHLVAVPTPFQAGGRGDPQPDLSYVLAAGDAIATVARPHDLVILESTSPPGATEKLAKHLQGLGCDQLLYAYCPERVLPGHILRELVENDRVVGGLSPEATERAVEFYRHFVSGEVLATTARTAEYVKLAENTFRDINIAYANELAMICERDPVDVAEVITLANRHPRVQILNPGIGVGGHCISVDPWFLVSSAPQQAEVIRQARRRNDGTPVHLAKRLAALMKARGFSQAALLGVAYKPDVDDDRESPAWHFATALTKLEINVAVADPLFVDHPHLVSTQAALAQAEVIIVGAGHSVFKALEPEHVAGWTQARLVFDPTASLDHQRWSEAGFHILKVGNQTGWDV
ncbi:MAG: UDP-N-acetyl-D-mannosamine dehydrogenase [Myxococcales bacterium]|nr:UDP-N-acetyl-D-mannosamine dehydrogenase [Myxococcales bacterium]